MIQKTGANLSALAEAVLATVELSRPMLGRGGGSRKNRTYDQEGLCGAGRELLTATNEAHVYIDWFAEHAMHVLIFGPCIPQQNMVSILHRPPAAA